MVKPFRFPWSEFPDVLIHAEEIFVKKHPSYMAAKSGDVDAASELVLASVNEDVLYQLQDQFDEAEPPTLISVHAEEAVGVNAIPEIMADYLSYILQWRIERFVIQANVVNHTGANGFSRMAKQAVFEGEIAPGKKYVIVDDFIGQGGTIANLRGHILAGGGEVIGSTVLTGKSYSAILSQQNKQLLELRERHGQIEDWWKEHFGFGFDCLTESETRYLIKTPTSEKIRGSIQEYFEQNNQV